MPVKRIIRFLGLGLLICTLPRVKAQVPGASHCPSPMIYENHNQIDPKPLRLNMVEGRATDSGGSEVWSACLGLFSEEDHTLLATTQTRQDGSFSFKNIPPGRYRLVVTSLGFCSANVPLRVVAGRPRPTNTLVLHMVPTAIDTCSYGDLGRAMKR